MRFEWDPDKARRNLRKHGISFEEAATAFADPLSLTIEDPDHSQEEDRFATIAASCFRRLIVVIHTDRRGTIRIISARLAGKSERRAYASL